MKEIIYLINYEQKLKTKTNTTRTKTKLRNVFEKNVSADIKLSKTQISKVIQSGGFSVHY